MEKDRSSKVVAIVALLVGVVGLSLGFAAFSNTLTIKPSATVTPESSTFNVDFSSTAEGAVGTTVTATYAKATTATALPTADTATINNDAPNGPEITGLKALFTEPGQTVTYTFYARNLGEYLAYLNNITFSDVTAEVGDDVELTAGDKMYCLATDEETTDALVEAACAGITVTVKVGTDINATADSTNIADIDGRDALAKLTGNEQVQVVIEYAEGSERADGPFKVVFGDITLTYGSVD